jgi:hypothetical protein
MTKCFWYHYYKYDMDKLNFTSVKGSIADPDDFCLVPDAKAFESGSETES